MHHPSLRNHSSGLRIFSAFLLTWLLIIAPLVPVAAGSPRRSERRRHASESKPQDTSSGTSTTVDDGFLNAPVPAPPPVPFVPVITATKTDALISDDGDGKADPGTSEKIEYTVTISNTGTTDATNVTFSDTIDTHTTLVPGSVNTQPIADPDTYSASGNIAISLAAPGVLTNDRDPDTGNNTGLTVSKVQGVGANVGVATDTTATGRAAVKGSVTLNSNGSFTYEPPPGFTGADSFTYEITDGTKTDTATVTINITGMVWFISNNAGGLNRGTFTNPFTTIASFNTANAASGVTPDPKNGDFIALRTGTGTYTETDGINLRAQQKLIGNMVQFNTVFTADANSIAAYNTFAASVGITPLGIVTTAGNGVDLSTDNTVRGFNVGNTPGFFKFNGGAVGSPIINTINLGGLGGALNVSTSGAFGANVTFGTFESTSSPAANVNLINVTGTLGIGNNPAAVLNNSAAGSAAVNVSGGNVSFTYTGSVTKATTGALVSISGGHTGTITFSTSTLSATAGTGFQFDNADGTYNFNGTNTLNGGDAGIDILNGSSGTFTFSASSTITSPTGTAFNVGTSPGNPNVTYSGSITDNTTGQRTVNIDGTTGGSISIATVTAASIAGGVGNTGININNANGNVTFTTLNLGTSGTRMTAQAATITGGTGTYGLGTVSIFTSAASGLVATNADGTLNVTTGTVNTTNQTAINIDGPAGFTTLGISLTSVTSAGGTANGISLQDTNGSFTINGDGSNTSLGGNATGGTISNKLGADGNNTQGIGVFMNNASGITLRRMTINGTNQNFGVRGNTVSNIVIEYSTINGANGTSVAADEGSIIFDGLTGTNTFTNLVVAGAIEDNFRVRNSSGTANNIVITGSTFTNAPNDNVIFEPSGTANVTAHVTNNTFTGAGGDHLQASTTNSATLNIVFTGNLYSGGFAGSLLQGITISGGNAGSAETVNFNISNNGTALNPLVGNVQGGAININKGNGNGTWQGQVSSNFIGNGAVANSGSAQSSGIRVENHAPTGTLTAIVNGNTIRQWNSGPAINTQAGDAGNASNNGVINVTLTNNVAANPGASAQHGFVANIGAGGASDASIACVDARTNTLDGNAATGGVGLRERHRFNSTIRIPGYTGAQYDITAVANFLIAQNPGNTANAATSSAGPGFTNTSPAGSPCPQPTVPSAPETSDSVLAKVVKPETIDHTASHQFDQSSYLNGRDVSTTSNQPSLLSRVVNAVSYFAGEIHSLVEPTASASSDQTSLNSAPRVADKATQSSNLRNAADAQSLGRTPEKGRKTAVSHHARISRVRPLLMSGENININIGTLRAGDSVTITFQVTVDNPPNLTLLNPPSVRNQGTVSGSNFSSVLTDDTAVGGASDPTDTPVDLFDTTTTLVSDLNPSNFGDQVTFTATVAENPAQGSVDPTGTVDFIDTSNGNAVICNDVALSSGSAQCQTSALTAGTHNIRADYSGDGNFDPSQSNIVAQVVIACTPNPIVTSTADSGAGTLREAVASVCSGTTITFNIAGAGPHTITLTTGELPVTKNVTINNNSGESITISGNNLSRVFNINSGKTAAIIGLTLSGGNNAGNGGGILNDGTLTVVNSTISGNTTGTDGGGISNSATGSLTLINTTISGNTANGNGGGVAVLGGTMTSINSTITNNKADNDNNASGTGGGIAASAGTSTLKNTIVAGNFNEDGTTDAADDISGTVDAASSFNLIGTGGAGGLTNGVNNNQVGVASPGLGALANNGGLTFTHALLSTSPAIEAGSNANLPADTFNLDGDADSAEPLPVDQRGTGFPRVADSADADAIQTVDIGAFELHPSIENITDKTTSEDTAVPQISFNVGDWNGGLLSSVIATSSNTTLIPNANLVVSPTGSVRTLDITPATNANSPADGTATITVTVTATNGQTATDTFVVTVTEVNDNPVATDDVLTAVNEDSGTRVIPFTDLTGNDSKGPANESGQTLTITNVSNPVGGTVVINGTNVEFTLTANFSGTASFDYLVTDNGTTNGVSDPKSDTGSVSFTVNGLNDPPTLATNTGITVAEGSTNNTITSAMLSVSDIDNTPSQIVFTIGTTPANGTLKKLGVALAGGATFTQDDINNNRITYDHDGSNTTSDSFTFTVSDGAGGSIGLTTFNITIIAGNDAPTITAGGTLNYTENDPPTAIDNTIIVTDSDSTNLASATAQITGNYVNGQDVLSFTNTATITGSFNAGTGTLTLTGSDTVANYQAALRAVRYNNTSENPSGATRTVSWVVNDGTLSSSPATSTINVSPVNDAPVNTVPGPQGTNQNTPLTFSIGNGNQISVADVDAGTNQIQVALTVTNGTLTLSGTTGLNFACGGCSGDGTADASMTFQGTITNINSALNGMTFTPTAGFSGAAVLTITTNDLGNTGSGGAKSDTDTVNIQVANQVNIQDASVAEPTSGTVDMIFTVTLSAPAPAGGASVQYATANGTANGGASCGGTTDYVSVALTTLNFAAGEQFKTISVTVCSDSDNAESNETFLVNLSNPTNTTIFDGQATGTITVANQAGAILISELRTSGPGGAGDDFVEIYNNSDSPHVVNGSGGGYGLFKMGATCSDTPILIGVIPNGTTIPGRGHYLFVGSAYSLANYGGTGNAAGDVTLSQDIENDRNVAIFSTALVGAISSANRFDAVGFGANTGGVCDLLREGATLTALSGSVLEYSYFRDECGKKGNPAQFGPCPTGGALKDSNVNSDDLVFIDTTGTVTPAGQRLGAPGPQNLGSPRFNNANIPVLLLDSTKGAPTDPNRVRNFSPVMPNGINGTLSIRRRFVNNTGAPVTRLRIRVVDISSLTNSVGIADLRLLDSTTITVSSIGDSGTCAATGTPNTAPCTVTVQGTVLETPPAQGLGGALNSSATVNVINLGTPLAPGASVNLQFLLGVQATGSFKFFFNIEALP